MKKHLPFLMYAFLSCLAGITAFAVLLVSAVGVAENGTGREIVFSDSEGEVLELMGETVYLPAGALDTLRTYPKRAANFALELMPISARRTVGYFSDKLYSHGARLFDEIYDNLYGFLSLGT